jgi:hypothetical protein
MFAPDSDPVKRWLHNFANLCLHTRSRPESPVQLNSARWRNKPLRQIPLLLFRLNPGFAASSAADETG